jgi:Cu(I)/Ag(I) efflux system protein CusF
MDMNVTVKMFLSVAAALSMASAAFAQTGSDQAAPDMTQAEARQDEVADGEVGKVDIEAGKITIRHGELKHLNMGAMSMAFRVRDASVFSTVKAGDKITFVPIKVNGQYLATQIVVKE